MFGYLAAACFDALDALTQVGCVLVASEDRECAALVHLLRQLVHDRHPGLHVVDTVEREPARFGRVAVERHDLHAAGDGVVDGARHLAGIGARDEYGRCAFVDSLRDPLRLDLSIFGRRRHPRDLDRHAMRGRQLLGGGLGARSRRQEHGIGGALGDDRDFQTTGFGRVTAGFGRGRAAGGRRDEQHARRNEFQNAHHSLLHVPGRPDQPTPRLGGPPSLQRRRKVGRSIPGLWRRDPGLERRPSGRRLRPNSPPVWRLPRAGVRQTACSPGRERPR